MGERNSSKGNKSIKRIVIPLVVIAAVIVGMYMLIHYVGGLGIWRGTTQDGYYKHVINKLSYADIPEEAQDFRYVCKNMGIAGISTVAFTLEEGYDKYVADIKEKAKEAADDKYEVIGKKVADTYDNRDEYGSYMGLPKDGLGYVVDDDIDGYDVLFYGAQTGSGTYTYAIVTNPDTKRVVIYSYGSN